MQQQHTTESKQTGSSSLRLWNSIWS